MANYQALTTALQDSGKARKQLEIRLKELEELEFQGQQELVTCFAERERRDLEFARLLSEERARRTQALQEYQKQMEIYHCRIAESIGKPVDF